MISIAGDAPFIIALANNRDMHILQEGENVSAKPETLQKLVILHTNDLHSHFEPMPRIAAYIDQHRQLLGNDELLVIDCGDHMDRAFLETEGSDGQANIAVMNATGYDIAVPGNNEGLTFTVETLQKLYGELADFPVVGSNMFLKDSGELPPWLQPYQIVKRGKLNIGIIGVTINYPIVYELLGWDVRDPFEIVARHVAQLRPSVHILIVVSHLGLNNDKRMAQEIPGIDLILGGHSHHLLEEPLMIGDTTLCAAGKFGSHIGKVELLYDHSAGRIAERSGGCVQTEHLPASSEIISIIHHYRLISDKNMRQVVTTIDEELDISWNQESRLGNLLADGLRTWCGADIGIVNAGQLLGKLEAGAVTRKILHEICPSPINPCRMILSGAEIREALEQSLLADYQDKPIRGYGFRGLVLGTLCVSGMTIEADARGPEMHKISHIRIGDRELTDDQKVVVGTIDMFTFGIGYLSLSRGRDIEYFLPEFLRDVLLHQLMDAERIALSSRRNWILRN